MRWCQGWGRCSATIAGAAYARQGGDMGDPQGRRREMLGKGSWGKLRDNLTCTVVKKELEVQSDSVFDRGLGGRLLRQAHLIPAYANGQILDLAALGSRAVHEFGNAS